MTNDDLKQAAAAMIAFSEGSPVQFKGRAVNSVWMDDEEPTWDVHRFLYRPKPEPKTCPWNRVTAPLLIEIKEKKCDYRAVIVSAGESGVGIGNEIGLRSYGSLLEDFTIRDGSPCGEIVP